MPNQQGGKNYKKSKHSTGTAGPRLEEAAPDELYGRVIRNLGNLNMNVYCNDNIVRICKVRGSMRKRIWINVGDLVIISLRDFDTPADEDEQKSQKIKNLDKKHIDRGDIVHKFDASLHSKAKKLAGINPKLFMALENADGKTLGELGARDDAEFDDENDGIIFDNEAGDSGEGEGGEKEKGEEDSDSSEEAAAVTAKPKKGKARESKHAVSSAADNDDLNIDDI